MLESKSHKCLFVADSDHHLIATCPMVILGDIYFQEVLSPIIVL